MVEEAKIAVLEPDFIFKVREYRDRKAGAMGADIVFEATVKSPKAVPGGYWQALSAKTLKAMRTPCGHPWCP